MPNKYAYYNEIDPKACAWLRQLIKNGLIMDGEVDERSIIDVQAMKGYGNAICPQVAAQFISAYMEA